MSTLTVTQRLELYYWMRLTRAFDDAMVAYWQQGRGVGGSFSQRGHEAISVGSAFALGPGDFIAPMHRDLGAYLLRGITPRRIFSNLLGRAEGVSGGRDANLHGMGDMSLGIAGFISHLPQSLGVAVGAAMAFSYLKQPHVALTYTGDGASSSGMFHEALNLAALEDAPVIIIVENNQYAYSTPLTQQMRNPNIAERAPGYGITGVAVDGNDVEAMYEVTAAAVARARNGDGPTLIEAKTMRMRGHALHDGAEYVPAEMLAEWELRDPLRTFADRLADEGVADATELEEIGARCEVEVADALLHAEAAPLPDPATITHGVYAA